MLSDLMLLNRATSTTANIPDKISEDKPPHYENEKSTNIRHSSKSRGHGIAYRRSVSKSIASIQGQYLFNHTSSSAWIDGLLGGKSKQGVFTADFLDDNGTVLTVRDGETALLNCSVYLRHNKTVTR